MKITKSFFYFSGISVHIYTQNKINVLGYLFMQFNVLIMPVKSFINQTNVIIGNIGVMYEKLEWKFRKVAAKS